LGTTERHYKGSLVFVLCVGIDTGTLLLFQVLLRRRRPDSPSGENCPHISEEDLIPKTKRSRLYSLSFTELMNGPLLLPQLLIYPTSFLLFPIPRRMGLYSTSEEQGKRKSWNETESFSHSENLGNSFVRSTKVSRQLTRAHKCKLMAKDILRLTDVFAPKFHISVSGAY
jgi:hypothetical protein